MNPKAFYNEQDHCWYIPVASELLANEDLIEGIEPVRLQLKDRQLLITKLEPVDA